jgi:hypothetical protein
MKSVNHIAAGVLQKLGFEASPGIIKGLSGGIDDIALALMRQYDMENEAAKRRGPESSWQPGVPVHQQGYEAALKQLGFWK